MEGLLSIGFQVISSIIFPCSCLLGNRNLARKWLQKPTTLSWLEQRQSKMTSQNEFYQNILCSHTLHLTSLSLCNETNRMLMDLYKYVFRTLRKLFKVDPADYMISICGNDALRELSSPGKSGSFFYLTNDDRYMIKTMKKSEVKVSLFPNFTT